MRRTPWRLVFIDETSITIKMARLRGRFLCGQRLKARLPAGRWRTQTFIAELRSNRLTAPWIISGAIDRKAFDTCVETQLAPALDKSDMVILDNLSVHLSAKAEAALRSRGAWMLFLQQCSPDLNLNEMAFSKLKAHLRNSAARAFDEPSDATGNICKLFEPEECWNYFKEAGYESV